MNAISAVDLALWDALGRVRQEPVYAMIGGAVRTTIDCYATGPRPDLARRFGFFGGKLPLVWSPSDGEQGLKRNIRAFSDMREAVGDDFPLMVDCWMALDVPYALRLMEGLRPYGLHWIEECLLPDDYWGYARIRQAAPPGTLVATGEHEATQHGFRLRMEMGCCDIIQPDVGWCGGLTELMRIAALADAHGVWTIPHGSSVYSYHFVLTRPASPFAEFLMMAPDAAQGPHVPPAPCGRTHTRRRSFETQRPTRLRGGTEPFPAGGCGPIGRWGPTLTASPREPGITGSRRQRRTRCARGLSPAEPPGILARQPDGAPRACRSQASDPMPASSGPVRGAANPSSPCADASRPRMLATTFTSSSVRLMRPCTHSAVPGSSRA